MTVRPLSFDNSSDCAEWKAFLDKNEHEAFHTPEWLEFMSKTFRNTEFYCFAWCDSGGSAEGKIRTILPAALVKSRFFGNRVISLAFIEYGGPAGSQEGVEELVGHLKKEFSGKASEIELREGIPGFRFPGMERQDHYKRFVLRLASAKETWDRIDKQKRKAVRKAENSGVTVRELSAADAGEFYDLYADNMRRFGSPPYSREYFENFFSMIVPKGMGKCFGAYKDGKLVSALLGNCCGQTVHVTIAVSDDRYLEFRPNDAVHWKFIEWACGNGYKAFDFGRVREESGQFRFKQKWNAELLALPHYYVRLDGRKARHADPANFRLITLLWSMMPLALTKKIGPYLREQTGI